MKMDLITSGCDHKGCAEETVGPGELQMITLEDMEGMFLVVAGAMTLAGLSGVLEVRPSSAFHCLL